MRKSVVIIFGLLNLFWALGFAYIFLTAHSDKWFMRSIVIYPVILFFSFTIKFIDKESDKLGHYIALGIYALIFLLAVGFIFFS